jgi:uridine kinase
MDDFYKPSNQRIHSPERDSRQEASLCEDFDWRRLHEQVLQPLCQNQEAYYQVYDWDRDAMGEWRTVSPGGITIVEGVSSGRKELSASFGFLIWVDCDRELRLARGLQRDGENARSRWVDEWMPAEDRYAALQKTAERANLRIDGSGRRASIANDQIYCLSIPPWS